MTRSKASAAQKRTSRPISVEAEKSVGIRLPGKLLYAVDTWASAHDTSRSEAIRRLIERGLTTPTPVDPYAVFERAIARMRETPGDD